MLLMRFNGKSSIIGRGGVGDANSRYRNLSFSDGTSTQTIASGIERTELATYGITATLQASDTNDYIDLTPITTTTTVTKEITKLYASVNGQAKLVFQSQSST